MNIIPFQTDIGNVFLYGDIDEEIYIWMDGNLYRLKKVEEAL